MNKIYVGNLPFQISESQLESEFGKFGEIKEIVLIKDRDTGRSRGFGFITFTTKEATKMALSINDKEIEGRRLKVTLAEAKPSPRNNGGPRNGFRDERGAGHSRRRF